jgi:hypothetical protein
MLSTVTRPSRFAEFYILRNRSPQTQFAGRGSHVLYEAIHDGNVSYRVLFTKLLSRYLGESLCESAHLHLSRDGHVVLQSAKKTDGVSKEHLTSVFLVEARTLTGADAKFASSSRNVGSPLTFYTALYTTRKNSSQPVLSGPQIQNDRHVSHSIKYNS